MEVTQEENSSIKYTDIVTVSSNAASMGGSQVFLETGEQITVNDLFKAICIASANDAIVALGEYTYGSEDNFIREMNTMAKKLGMNNTNFVNATGFHDANHYTTANDMATLALALLTNHKADVLKYTSMYEGYIREVATEPVYSKDGNRTGYYYDEDLAQELRLALSQALPALRETLIKNHLEKRPVIVVLGHLTD